MKTALLFASALLVLSGSIRPPAGAAEAGIPFQAISYNEALTSADREGKLVLVVFHTAWSEVCRQMDATTYSNQTLGAFVAAHAVALKLDMEREGRAVAQQHTVIGVPTLLLLKPDGTEVDRFTGGRLPMQLFAELVAAIDGRPTAVRSSASRAPSADQTSVRARYARAKELARDGDNAAALREFVWCFDTGMLEETSLRSVRLSFLISDIKRLADVYSPARKALVERQQTAERRLWANEDITIAAAEFAALCDALGESDRLLATFDALPPGDGRRAGLGHHVFKLLLQKKRYADLLSVRDPEQILAGFERTIARVPGQPAAAEASRRFAIRTALDDLELLAGAGQRDAARVLAARLLAFDATRETTSGIKGRLKRAGQPQLLDEPAGK